MLYILLIVMFLTFVSMVVFEKSLKESLIMTLIPFVGGYVLGCLIYAMLKNLGV